MRFRECYDADVVIRRELEGWPESGPVVGRDAVMRQWERVLEPWDTVTLEPVSIINSARARRFVDGSSLDVVFDPPDRASLVEGSWVFRSLGHGSNVRHLTVTVKSDCLH